MSALVDPDLIRTRFAAALSDMYRAEVPLYADLLAIVADVNARVLAERGEKAEARIEIERHGAIRVGTAEELATMARAFAVMGMEPVGYYDLAPAGVPVHSTAFRPTSETALAANPFRVFCSLLRHELIEDEALRAEVGAILARRSIFTPEALALIAQAERAAGSTTRRPMPLSSPCSKPSAGTPTRRSVRRRTSTLPRSIGLSPTSSRSRGRISTTSRRARSTSMRAGRNAAPGH
jgi:uncharacterized glyoxalase superfamily metalloenzyme YdcJ